MPTTRSRAKQSRLPEIGQQVGVNRLPPEILSRVFVICDHTWDPLDGGWKAFGCQTVLPAVCNYWRQVALDTTALWTKVTLLDRPPWHFSRVCLARAGPTALLDIDLDMEEDFWADTENGTLDELAERAEDALDFIVTHGGVPSRWRSFSMTTDVFLAQLAAMKLFGKSSFPSLVSIEMRFTGPYEFDDEDAFTLGEHIELPPKLLFKEPPPQLRSIKLQGVPGSYLFGHPAHPQFIALTHLELRFEVRYHSLTDFNKLLAANPGLESIFLELGDADRGVKVEKERLPKVDLPKLHTLSCVDVASPLWALHVIMMLDAPNIISFELTLGISSYQRHREQVGIQKLLDHIIGDQSLPNPEPRFPSLRSLTLASEMQLGSEHIIATVLAAYPQLTDLRLPGCPSLMPLLQRPWLAPGIERLRVGVSNLVQLKKVVNSRCKAGLPLRTVLVDHLELQVRVKPSDRDQLRKYVDFALVLDDGERIDDKDDYYLA
ncbi:unnamed protein product [Rhizoctonia solani]|uniref:F-box domain-containing protein n=2 Tax=Rhizoctonia solani TaxID=456999 RepID=A0A8H3DKD4_9AGAM|nr:unnamed protein product [Rhizoctonia solani]